MSRPTLVPVTDTPPSESTPLSPQSSQHQRSYNTSQQTPLPLKHADTHQSSSSDDSGSGYISGSGRRDSAIDSASRKSTLPRSPRNINLDQHVPRAGALSWALNAVDNSGASRAQSPGSSFSPRRQPSLRDGDPRVIGSVSGSQTPEASARRRISKAPKKSGSSGEESSKPALQREEAALVPDQDDDNSWAWFRNIADRYGAIELDNKGSVARDHLALERTFLAWLRTSLAFASIGIAITQLFRLNSTLHPDYPSLPPQSSPLIHLRTVGKPLGTTFLGVAILILLMGWRRYFESQYWIIRGKFPASRGSVFLVTFLTAALIVVSLVVVVIVGKVA